MGEIINNINWEFIIAIIAILISVYSIYIQRRHNTLTYKPIPVVIKYNYTNHISVKIWNKGTGPLIIKPVYVDDSKNLIDILPKKVRRFKFVEYINDFRDRTISSNSYLNMIEFKIRNNDKQEEGSYTNALTLIKKQLDKKVIKIVYFDIYNNKMSYNSYPLNFSDGKDEIEFKKFSKTKKRKKFLDSDKS